MSKPMFFRTNFRGRGKRWRLVADALNKIGNALNNITIDGNDAQISAAGITLTSSATSVATTTGGQFVATAVDPETGEVTVSEGYVYLRAADGNGYAFLPFTGDTASGGCIALVTDFSTFSVSLEGAADRGAALALATPQKAVRIIAHRGGDGSDEDPYTISQEYKGGPIYHGRD